MTPRLDIGKTRDHLKDFAFDLLFRDDLGWTQPVDGRTHRFEEGEAPFSMRELARLSEVVALEISTPEGAIPEKRVRMDIHRAVAKVHGEHLLVFVDRARRESVWSWVKREDGRALERAHFYSREQPGDLFLSKLSALVVDVVDLEGAGRTSIAEVARRLQEALDVERVTKKFYAAFEKQHERLIQQIAGIPGERPRRWYASVLLNRLMFVYFLQKKRFLDNGDTSYLRNKLAVSGGRGPDRFYRDFLLPLFFEGFAKPERGRSAETQALLGEIRYLDGGLFLHHPVEMEHPEIAIPDEAFTELFDLFERYSWNLNDTPGGQDDEINPDVLGYIFEKYINQKAFGAYYTRPEITGYLCEETIYRLIVERVEAKSDRRFESIQELFLKLDADLCHLLLTEILPGLSILDPACGSGAFLVAALRTLIDVYAAAVGRAELSNHRNLKDWLKKAREAHSSLYYFIKKKVITENLFGVDIMEEAVEIAKLRLFLSLVASAGSVEELEPLPNIDFNILSGDSLIGLLHVRSEDFECRQQQGNLFVRPFSEILREKNRMIDGYRHASTYGEDLRQIRDGVATAREEAAATLDDMLLGEFQALGVKVEEATWDEAKGKEGKLKKRALKFEDIQALRPFHWGYEFDQVLEGRGGFDVILTNPPWEVLKPQAKEFFADHSEILITKNKMAIKDFEKERDKLLADPSVRRAWFDYQNRFPHVSLFFRSSPDYANQISVVNGKRAGTDVNLYKLFVERCYRLLRKGGFCGILTPTSLYSDLGTKQLRLMLFEGAKIEALFGLSNEKYLFEGVHHSFRICILVFEKGGRTEEFTAAFRINPREAVRAEKLEMFLHDSAEHLALSRKLVERLSPDSFSVLEFKDAADIQITEKMLRFPRLGDRAAGKWNFVLTNEFHMTNDSAVFRTRQGKSSLALFTGRMFNQYTLTGEHSGYWIPEAKGRALLLGKEPDEGQLLDYQGYRWVHRRIARDTDSRTMISTMAPKRVFTEVNSTTIKVREAGITAAEMLYLTTLTNSFAFDWFLRFRVSSTLNMFHIYQVPVPRKTAGDSDFPHFVHTAARLICTAPEFGDLWNEVMNSPWTPESGATDPAERGRLRAELDGRVAHLYGLTEDEFVHILATFPVVPEAEKSAALEAYRTLAPKSGDPEIATLVAQGESAVLEFKAAARKTPELEKVIIKTVAAFLNAQGGTLLIGIADDASAVGLDSDYQSLGKKGNRDGFELFLTHLLLDNLGKDLAPHIRITFHSFDGHEICRVHLTPAPRLAYVREGHDEILYLRTGNSTRRLSTREAVDYAASRKP